MHIMHLRKNLQEFIRIKRSKHVTRPDITLQVGESGRIFSVHSDLPATSFECFHNQKFYENHFFSHHVFFGGSSSPMFDSLSMLTASNSGSRHGLRQALRFRKRRLRRTPQSPTLLPPFKSSDTICTATGADIGKVFHKIILTCIVNLLEQPSI